MTGLQSAAVVAGEPDANSASVPGTPWRRARDHAISYPTMIGRIGFAKQSLMPLRGTRDNENVYSTATCFNDLRRYFRSSGTRPIASLPKLDVSTAENRLVLVGQRHLATFDAPHISCM